MHPLLHPAGRIVPYIIVHQINQYRAFRIIRKAGPVKESSLQPRNAASYAKKRQKKAGATTYGWLAFFKFIAANLSLTQAVTSGSPRYGV